LMVGAGLAALAVSSARGLPSATARHQALENGYDYGWRDDPLLHEIEGDEGPVEAVKDKAAAAADAAKTATRNVRDKMRSAKYSAAHRYDEAGAKIGASYERQPLAFGALAAALGLAVAVLLPPTRREDELMGDLRDEAK